MSSIWHITNQDENTTDVPEKENFVVLIGHWTSCLWYGGEEPEPIFWENVKKWCYLDDLLALETELAKCKKQVKKLREQNRILRESVGEYFNKWIDANIQAIKDKDQIRVLTEQEQARHQLIIDQLKGLK